MPRARWLFLAYRLERASEPKGARQKKIACGCWRIGFCGTVGKRKLAEQLYFLGCCFEFLRLERERHASATDRSQRV